MLYRCSSCHFVLDVLQCSSVTGPSGYELERSSERECVCECVCVCVCVCVCECVCECEHE